MADAPEKEVEAEPEESLRDTIVAAAADTEAETETATETAKTETTEAATETEAAATETETTESETAKETDAEVQDEVDQTVEPTDAPAHWKLEHQEMFRKLDPDAQSFLMDRSKEMEAAHTRRSQEIAPMRKLSEAWQPYLNQVGSTPDQYFNAIAQTEHNLRSGTNEQRINILMGLARDYGVDFGQNGNGQQAPTAEEDPFGIQQKIMQAVGPLAHQVQQISGNFQQQSTAHQQAQTDAAQGQIESFREEKGADGKPAHPHYDEVYDDMLVLAQAKQQSGQSVDLAQLYEATCWSNASVRKKIQAGEAWTKRQAEQQKAAQQKAAAGSLTGGAGSRTEQPQEQLESGTYGGVESALLKRN